MGCFWLCDDIHTGMSKKKRGKGKGRGEYWVMARHWTVHPTLLLTYVVSAMRFSLSVFSDEDTEVQSFVVILLIGISL